MNEININMKEVIVETKSRQLRSEWSTELISDLNVYHNIDASDELERLLGNEIKREMRKKKIERILKHMA
jgi:hypothetical protein